MISLVVPPLGGSVFLVVSIGPVKLLPEVFLLLQQWYRLQPTSEIPDSAPNSGMKSDAASVKLCLCYSSDCAFSLFRSKGDEEDEAEKKEEELILLLKRAKVSLHIQGENFDAASEFLHRAAALAHQTNNHQAVVYTYIQMANLAFLQGQLEQAEKLFKAAMSFLLAGGAPLDHNAVVEMSLKLSCMYAEQNRAELAEHGFRFCMESLEAKLQKEAALKEEERTDEQEVERKNTRLLLGLCLDSRARYRTSSLRLQEASEDYQRALEICSQEQGPTHPQTLVLMNDLATVLDLRGLHDEALVLVQQAVELSRSSGHPDLHRLLGNMAGVLLHKGRLDQALRLYQEALSLSHQVQDQETVDQILDGLEEVKRRRRLQETKDKTNKD
uniref:Tetratricopeptide repeat domain 19 n=1 Tax=Cynoglossus semilaevis TaxID=244447 RepID=A0A3P8W603_CYNSE